VTFQGEQIASNRTRLILQLCLIVAMTMAAYFPALNAGFIWDDDRYVTNNPLLTAPDGLRRIWFSLDSPSQYFPLTYTSFRIERALWGLRPFGYHLTNLLLHIANALLVWRLLARLNVPGALLAAGIFALHPVQVESVAWITERKNLLMGFFFLLALIAWIAFVDERTRQRRRFYTLALVFYGLALFSKATACTLPAALVLILWLQEKPVNRERLIQISPFVLLGLLMGLLVRWWERYHQGTYGAEFAIGLRERLVIASHAVWFYASKLIWPSKLTFTYPRWPVASNDPLAYGWLVGLIGIFAVIFFARRIVGRGPEVAVAFFIASRFCHALHIPLFVRGRSLPVHRQHRLDRAICGNVVEAGLEAPSELAPRSRIGGAAISPPWWIDVAPDEDLPQCRNALDRYARKESQLLVGAQQSRSRTAPERTIGRRYDSFPKDACH